MILERLQSLFNDVTGRSDIILTKRTRMKDDLGLSSFTLVRLACAIEDEFNLEIPNVRLVRFKTVGDVIKFLNENGIE